MSSDTDKSLKIMREQKQFENVADNADDMDFEPDNMPDSVSLDEADDVIDVEAKLEFQSQLNDYIFRGIPMKDMPVLNTEVYFGAIDQARKEIINTGDGIYAPFSREGRTALKAVCAKLKSPDFDSFQTIESAQLVEFFNANQSAGFYFQQQPDGSFALQPREAATKAGDGEGLRQDIANTSTNEMTANDEQSNNSITQGR